MKSWGSTRLLSGIPAAEGTGGGSGTWWRRLAHALPDGRVLLDDVSFRVGEGSTAALVGANGAGKTTLLRIIAGDLSRTTGSVVVAAAASA